MNIGLASFCSARKQPGPLAQLSLLPIIQEKRKKSD